MADYVNRFRVVTTDNICRIKFIDETGNPPIETVIGEITTNKISLQALADVINDLLKKPREGAKH